MHEKQPAETGHVGLCMPHTANKRPKMMIGVNQPKWTLFADQAASRLSYFPSPYDFQTALGGFPVLLIPRKEGSS